jgi:hypothetical protein
MRLSKMWDWIKHKLRLEKTRSHKIVKLIKKGYINEASLSSPIYGPYLWRFDIDGDELSIIYNNDTTNALWSAFKDNKLKYLGNYTGMIQRYPYIYDYIEYM